MDPFILLIVSSSALAVIYQEIVAGSQAEDVLTA
jgi:hypothetical protein